MKEREDDPFRFLDLVKPEANQVPKLGVISVEISKELAKVLPDARKPCGIIVAARSGQSEYSGAGQIEVGDGDLQRECRADGDARCAAQGSGQPENNGSAGTANRARWEADVSDPERVSVVG